MGLSAIAVPESFEAFLERYGAKLVKKIRFLDHHRFADWELQELYRQTLECGADMLVTTEKDAVRIPATTMPAVPFFYLRVEIEILAGVADFEEAVSRLCFPKREMKATRKAN